MIINKPDYFNNEIKTEDDLASLFQLDTCEIRFLNNAFFYLNKYFIRLNQCDDYSNKFIHIIGLMKFMTRSKLMKYLLLFNSFPSNGETASQPKHMTRKIKSPQAYIGSPLHFPIIL